MYDFMAFLGVVLCGSLLVAALTVVARFVMKTTDHWKTLKVLQMRVEEDRHDMWNRYDKLYNRIHDLEKKDEARQT